MFDLAIQGVIQSAFLWGYMATQLIGGTLADRLGGKRVMAAGMLWFSLASLLLPLALSAPVVAAGLTVPAVLLARCCVVGDGHGEVDCCPPAPLLQVCASQMISPLAAVAYVACCIKRALVKEWLCLP